MADFFDEWRPGVRSLRPVLSWAVLTMAFGGAGPFGTYHALGLGERLLFWGGVLAAATLGIVAMRALVFGPLGLRNHLAGTAVVSALLAVVMAPLVQLLLQALPKTAQIAVPGLFLVAGAVFCLSLATAMCCHLSGRFDLLPVRRDPVPEVALVPDPPPPPPPLPRLADRLPADVQGRLISITVRDHYVEVTTQAGTASLLLRLSDAMAETGDDEGVQVHRSHWVAWSAIKAVEIRGARMVLRLSSGAEVPVSKTYRPRVQARGIGITRVV